jgi:hypothetical protein
MYIPVQDKTGELKEVTKAAAASEPGKLNICAKII